MLERLAWAYVLACGLAGCSDCGGGGLFGSSESAAAAPPQVDARVRVDAGSTVVIEITQSTSGGACAAGTTETLRFVWDAAMARPVASTVAPPASARTVTGAMLGGGVTTYESVIPGLTIRVSGNAFSGLTVTFESGASTSTLRCSTFAPFRCA